jgi:hypothetical protein
VSVNAAESTLVAHGLSAVIGAGGVVVGGSGVTVVGGVGGSGRGGVLLTVMTPISPDPSVSGLVQARAVVGMRRATL